jgi:DNA-binding NarL/FixJ family response regulator
MLSNIFPKQAKKELQARKQRFIHTKIHLIQTQNNTIQPHYARMHMATPHPISRKNAQLRLDPEEVPHRVREIAMMRGLGYTFREIAQQLNITPQAVSLMLSRHRRALKTLNGAMELCHLSARAVNALGRHGISTREEARHRNVLQLLHGERNCGRKTLDEIERWMSEGSENQVQDLQDQEAAC